MEIGCRRRSRLVVAAAHPIPPGHCHDRVHLGQRPQRTGALGRRSELMFGARLGRWIPAGLARAVVTTALVSRYDTLHVEIFGSARKHGIADLDIAHAVDHAMAAGEQDDGKVVYLGPDRAGNMLEVVSVLRDDGTEIVIHAMWMRRIYETYLPDKGDTDG